MSGVVGARMMTAAGQVKSSSRKTLLWHKRTMHFEPSGDRESES